VKDVVSCGTTGEFCSMDLHERKRVTEIVAGTTIPDATIPHHIRFFIFALPILRFLKNGE